MNTATTAHVIVETTPGKRPEIVARGLVTYGDIKVALAGFRANVVGRTYTAMTPIDAAAWIESRR